MAGNRADGRDFFGLYINGCLTPCLATWYFRALSLVGMDDVAEQAARELDEGFAQDYFMGGVGAANEFYTWEGLVTGYEGALVGVPHSLLSVLRHRCPRSIPDPEWYRRVKSALRYKRRELSKLETMWQLVHQL